MKKNIVPLKEVLTQQTANASCGRDGRTKSRLPIDAKDARCISAAKLAIARKLYAESILLKLHVARGERDAMRRGARESAQDASRGL